MSPLLEKKNPALEFEKPTAPISGVGVANVSVTMTVHVVFWPTVTVEGPHEWVVDVGCRARAVVLPELPMWFASPPYTVVRAAVPAEDAEKVTEQLDFPTTLSVREHGLPVNEPVRPTWAKPTTPVGVELVPGELSVTVAIQVVIPFTTKGSGEHETMVDVTRLSSTVEFVIVGGKAPLTEGATAAVTLIWPAKPPMLVKVIKTRTVPPGW